MSEPGGRPDWIKSVVEKASRRGELRPAREHARHRAETDDGLPDLIGPWLHWQLVVVVLFVGILLGLTVGMIL